MLDVVKRILTVVFEFARAPVDAVLGINRRRYAMTLDVEAPKSVTWSILSAHKITLEGNPPIILDAAPDPARPGVYAGSISFSGRQVPLAYRILEERPGEAMLMTVIKQESAPECCPGEDYVCGSAVSGDETASIISMSYEITHTRFVSRLLIPLAAVQNASRIKKNAEIRAGKEPDVQSFGTQVKNAAVTGALTFASFFAIFTPSDAAMLVILILIHELGHVAGMKWVGQPVRGIYFVPFLGGVAVSADRYRNEGERGLVALMGPGFCVLTTALIMFLAQQTENPLLHNLAILSAILNGFNLLPVLPLDGGHIAQSLLSRTSGNLIRGFNALTILAGAMVAVAIEAYSLLLILLLVSPLIFSKSAAKHSQLPPLTRPQTAWLALAYIATFVFYAASITTLAKPAPEHQAERPASSAGLAKA